jgi:enolase-phosphatase E1
LAQQLLFGSTNAGDLTPFLNGYFDTAVGPKASTDSYVAIAARVSIPPQEMLFVSDIVAEVDAARRSGMQTALCVRGGEPASGTEAHPVFRSFDAIVE